MTRILAIGLVPILACACASSKLNTMTAIPAAPRIGEVAVLAELEREPDIITEDFQPFFAGIARSLRDDYDSAGAFDVLIQERDLGGDPAAPGTLLVNYRLTNFTVTSDMRGGYLGNLMACSVTLIPCFWMGAIRPTKEVVRASVEMRVHDITNMSPEQVTDPRSGSRSLEFDTLGTPALLTRDYDLRVEALIGFDKPDERLEFTAEMAAELAHQLMDQSLPDISSGIRR